MLKSGGNVTESTDGTMSEQVIGTRPDVQRYRNSNIASLITQAEHKMRIFFKKDTWIIKKITQI